MYFQCALCCHGVRQTFYQEQDSQEPRGRTAPSGEEAVQYKQSKATSGLRVFCPFLRDMYWKGSSVATGARWSDLRN